MKRILITLAATLVGMSILADGVFAPSEIAWLVTSMSDSKPSAFPGANKWQIDGVDSPLLGGAAKQRYAVGPFRTLRTEYELLRADFG